MQKVQHYLHMLSKRATPAVSNTFFFSFYGIRISFVMIIHWRTSLKIPSHFNISSDIFMIWSKSKGLKVNLKLHWLLLCLHNCRELSFHFNLYPFHMWWNNVRPSLQVSWCMHRKQGMEGVQLRHDIIRYRAYTILRKKQLPTKWNAN